MMLALVMCFWLTLEMKLCKVILENGRAVSRRTFVVKGVSASCTNQVLPYLALFNIR